MARLLTVLLVLTVVACVVATPLINKTFLARKAQAHGSFSVGNVADGKFGDSSFSIGHGGPSNNSGEAGHRSNQVS
ncbi:hypothetical protein B5X24_HaOG204380 [Helicoverpa armigera]|uniref:Uncharacterized protein n=1 Tax=Helicoverpa armigera TaxID=29058 RepID=A0A2W1BNH2_HELAM|nr:hypothetical protein B5X24_HaOG204380 [Helicoverpa armigera]